MGLIPGPEPEKSSLGREEGDQEAGAVPSVPNPTAGSRAPGPTRRRGCRAFPNGRGNGACGHRRGWQRILPRLKAPASFAAGVGRGPTAEPTGKQAG